jgi:7,8-dihydroneopterin aldolase/epimerase/oxygenase
VSEPDRIELRGLRTMGVCGILPEEQTRPQPLELDLDVVADLSVPAASDRVEDTIDYSALCAMVERIVTEEKFALLEALAQRVAEAVMADSRAQAVTVAVRKLRPPVPHQLASSGVRLTRARDQIG